MNDRTDLKVVVKATYVKILQIEKIVNICKSQKYQLKLSNENICKNKKKFQVLKMSQPKVTYYEIKYTKL